MTPFVIVCHLSGVLHTMCAAHCDICHVIGALGVWGGHAGCCSPLFTHCFWTCGLCREREAFFGHEPVCLSTGGPTKGQDRKQHKLIIHALPFLQEPIVNKMLNWK